MSRGISFSISLVYYISVNSTLYCIKYAWLKVIFDDFLYVLPTNWLSHLHLFCFTFMFLLHFPFIWNLIGGVMVSMLASSVIDQGFKPWSSQSKDYKIGICCFSTKHAALWSKSKDGLAWNQYNVSGWSDTSTHILLFQWAGTIKTQPSVLI